MKKALCFLLAIIFVCCVITHGENKRFSLEKMITNLTNFQDMPTMQDIAECWTMDYYYVAVETYASAGGGSNSGGFGQQIVYYEEYDGENELLMWLDSMVGFFKRLARTMKIIGEMIICIFDNVQYLLPWNNTVPKGVI